MNPFQWIDFDLVVLDMNLNSKLAVIVVEDALFSYVYRYDAFSFDVLPVVDILN